MTYSMKTPIMGPSRGDPDVLADWAIARGSLRPDEVRAYLATLHEACIQHGMSFEIAVAQSIHETSVDGVPWASPWWANRLNPAGMGITGDPAQNLQSPIFLTGSEAARAHFVHLWLYAVGIILPDGFVARDDPRWQAGLQAGYAGIAPTIAGLTNRWGVDDAYARKIVDHLNALDADGLLSEEGGVATSKNWYILNVAGHRSTGDPGNPVERALTDDLALAYTNEARARGYRSDWWQRDLDKDSLPDMTQGDLSTVAAGVGKAIGASTAPMVIMLDLHFDGADSVVHTIVPDSVGLTSGFPGGAPAADTAANNSLDVRIARDITAAIVRATGISSYPARRLGVVGVMSERDTRVGEQGYRLGMFGGTAPYRQRAVRLVIEHGGTTNMTRVPNWAAKCATAALDAIDAVYAERNAGGGGGQPPVDPPVDPVDYADPLPIPDLAAFIKAGTLVATPPPIIQGVSGTFVFVGQRVIARKKTARKQDVKGDKTTGPDINAGESFPVLFMQLSTDVGPHWITGWLTRVLVADTEVAL